MLKFGFLLFQVTCGQEESEVPVPQQIPNQPSAGVATPVTVPIPVPVPVPVPITVPLPVPVPVPVPVIIPAAADGVADGSVDGGGREHISPEEAASCEAHPDCEKHDGLCCPTEEGNMLACCSSVLSHWQADHMYIVTLVAGASVYKEASSTSEQVSKYEYGRAFDVIDTTLDEQGDVWLQTHDGWVLSACPETGEHVADHVIPPEPEVHTATAPQGLVVREGLSKSTARVGVIKRGELFHVLERAFSEQGTLRLRIGTNQWVSETCSKTGERIAEPTAPADGEQYTITSNEGVRVYEGKDLEKRVDGVTFNIGDKVTVIERSIDQQGVCLLRTSRGWLSEKSASGAAVAVRTLRSQAARDAAEL